MRDESKEKISLAIFLIIGLINVVYIFTFFLKKKYLPPPFVYDKNNTFMDFYNSLYWSMHDGIYTIWESVYPPLNFVILKLISVIYLPQEVLAINSDPFDIRHNIGFENIEIVIIFFACFLFSILISKENISKIKLLILGIIFAISPPFLFAIERGNLIILCLPIYSYIINNTDKRIDVILYAVIVNIKPYFLIINIIKLFNYNKNKEQIKISILAIVLIYIVSGTIINQEYYLVLLNILKFGSNDNLINARDILGMPTTILSAARVNDIVQLPKQYLFVFNVIKICMILYLINIIKFILINSIENKEIYVLSILIITNYFVEAGSYSLILYIPIIIKFFKEKNYKLFFITMLILYIPDINLNYFINIDYLNNKSLMDVYLSRSNQEVEYYLTLRSIVTPIMNWILLHIYITDYDRKKNV